MKRPVLPAVSAPSADRLMCDGRETEAPAPPKLAVIITCWNYEDYVVRAIESVQSQACPDCELVVIDDGSTDGSWRAIQKTGAQAYCVENGGQRRACLYGLKKTSAPFILFLDADDELRPGSIATIIAHLDQDVAKLQFPLIRIDTNRNIISGPIPPLRESRGMQIAEQILRTGTYATPPTSGNVFRRDVCHVIAEAVYDTAVDGIILFSAPFMGATVSLSEPLGLYRVHGRNDSGMGEHLNSQLLQRDLKLFRDRAEHLRQFLKAYDRSPELVPAEKTYFYCERSFYLSVSQQDDKRLEKLLPLLKALWRERRALSSKLAIGSFFLLTALLPRERASRGLAYRLQPQTRSSLGFVQAIMQA